MLSDSAVTGASHLVSSHYSKAQQQLQRTVVSGTRIPAPVVPRGQAPHFHHTLVSVVCTEGEDAKFEGSVSGE